MPFELLYRDTKDLDLPNEKNNFEKKVTDLLKKIKASEAISEIDYKKLKPRGSSFGVLYGLCKTHKKVLDKCPPLLLKIALNFLRKNVNKILNTLWAVLTLSPSSPIYHWKKLLKFVVTHFIRIKNCCVMLVKVSEKLLRASLSNNYFLFDGIIYEQVDGVSYGFLFGP